MKKKKDDFVSIAQKRREEYLKKARIDAMRSGFDSKESLEGLKQKDFGLIKIGVLTLRSFISRIIGSRNWNGRKLLEKDKDALCKELGFPDKGEKRLVEPKKKKPSAKELALKKIKDGEIK